jgi:hypothetical protein
VECLAVRAGFGSAPAAPIICDFRLSHAIR